MSHDLEDLTRLGYAWFNEEREPPPWWLPDGEYINSTADPDHATYHGIDAIREQHQGWVDSYPDLRVEPLEIRVNGDRTFVWVRFTGHSASGGVPLEMELAQVVTSEGMKIRRIEEFMDRDEGLTAAGLTD